MDMMPIGNGGMTYDQYGMIMPFCSVIDAHDSYSDDVLHVEYRQEPTDPRQRCYQHGLFSMPVFYVLDES